VCRDAKCSQIGHVALVSKKTVAAGFVRLGNGIVSAAKYDDLTSLWLSYNI